MSGTGPPVPSRRLGGLTARLGEASGGARAGQGRRPWLSALLVVASVLVSLLAIEGALRLFQPFELRLMGDEIRLPYFKRYELSVEGAKSLEPFAVHSKNALGFRGPERPADFARYLSIVAIGGSTTECFMLGDGRDWPAALGHLFARNFDRLWVNNAGINGHTTYGHLELMRQHVVPLRPRVALFLVGLNDTEFEAQKATYDARLSLADDDSFERVLDSVRLRLARESHLAALLWNISGEWRAERAGLVASQVEYDFWALPDQRKPPGFSDSIVEKHRKAEFNGYAGRIGELVALARGAGIEPVFITQPTLYGEVVDEATGLDLARFGDQEWRVLEAYNDVLRRTAAEHGALVIDLAARLAKSTRYFYDFYHFTGAGAERVAEIVYAELCPYLAARFPEYATAACELPRVLATGPGG